MVALFNLILQTPLHGILILIILFNIYLWREQGKIKSEIKTMERYLDDKKVDKNDFKTYMKNHEKIHSGVMDKLDLAIKFLMGGKP